MKKFITAILAASLTLSLAACSAKEQKTTAADAKPQQEAKQEVKKDQLDPDFKAKEVAQFSDILDNLGNKDYFYLDTAGGTIKILDKAKFKTYADKAKAIREKAMTDQKVDMANTKVYTYYSNVSGKKSEKDFVVVLDANKVPTDLYEVTMTINDSDEPALKDAKKVDKAVDDKFKELFKKTEVK